MQRAFTFFVLMFIVVQVSWCEEKKQPKISITELSDKTAVAKFEFVDGNMTIRFNSRNRSGDFTITADKGTWPEKVTILFEGINALEHIDVSAGRIYANGSRSTSGKFGLYLLDNDRNFNTRSRIGTLDVRVEPQQSGMRVTFPDKFFADADKVVLSWVTWLDR